MVPGAVPATHPQPREPGVPFGHHQVVAEELEARYQHVFPMRDQLPPVLQRRRVSIGLQQPEVAGAVVRPNGEPAPVVVDVVLVTPLPRQERLQRRVRVRRVEIPELGGQGLVRPDQDVLLRPAQPDTARENVSSVSS